MKNVAIIGGGVAGLLSLRHILQCTSLNPTLFECTQWIGGVWSYDGKDNEFNENDYRTNPVSIYKNLITNQPKQVMEFPDFLHEDPTLPTYQHHESVLNYLRRFAEKFDLVRSIRFNHRVQLITSINSGSGDGSGMCRWKLTVTNTEEMVTSSHIFDAVVVCSGHYTKPHIPNITGMNCYKGRTLHSRYYRSPDNFSGESVLLVGAGASGIDIALDVSTSARRVYLSNRGSLLKSPLPANVIEVPEVSQFEEDSCVFVDGRELSVVIDSVIYSTGYLNDYPFLDRTCGIEIRKNRVMNLFKHIVNIKYNTMLFVGIPNRIPVFKILYLQAVYVSKILSNQIILPTESEMLSDESNDLQRLMKFGWNPGRAHVITDVMFEYADYLANASSVEKIPNNIRNLYYYILKRRAENCMTYKQEDYDIENFWNVTGDET